MRYSNRIAILHNMHWVTRIATYLRKLNPLHPVPIPELVFFACALIFFGRSR